MARNTNCASNSPVGAACSIPIHATTWPSCGYRAKRRNWLSFGDDLAWDVVDIQQIHHFSHRQRAGLQMADIVTSAFYRGLGQANGRAGDVRFSSILKPRVAGGSEGVFGYGVKLQPDHWDKTLRNNQREIFEMFGAPQKGGRPPDPIGTAVSRPSVRDDHQFGCLPKERRGLIRRCLPTPIYEIPREESIGC
jgi:hypothetical protein